MKALLLAATVVLMAGGAYAQQEPLHSNSQVDLNPDLGAPAGPPVPFKIVCYQHGITPYAIVDQTGNTLFKIECP